jgi:hypothetical protein
MRQGLTRKEVKEREDTFWGTHKRDVDAVKKTLEAHLSRARIIGEYLGLEATGFSTAPQSGKITVFWEHGLQVVTFGVTFKDAKTDLFRKLGKLRTAIYNERAVALSRYGKEVVEATRKKLGA